MISNYALYNHHEENNTLYILLDDRKYNKIISKNNVDCLLHDNDLVGYKIENFIRYAKIKYSGIVFYPNSILIDVINSILKNDGLEILSYKTNSGYKIVKDDNKLKVYAERGTFLRDETISNGRFCTYYDLYIDNINPNELIIIDEENLEGKDFFGDKEIH